MSGELDRLQARCDELGLRIIGPLASDLGWRPGFLLGPAVTNAKMDALRADGYLLAPSGRHTIVELK